MRLLTHELRNSLIMLQIKENRLNYTLFDQWLQKDFVDWLWIDDFPTPHRSIPILQTLRAQI